jgi:hypothetical protein
MDHRVRLAVLSATLALPGIASPQAMTGPAKVLSVGREIVKPGKSTLHAKWETAWARALEAAKYSDHFIAMASVTGPNEVWFMSGYNSLEEMQKAYDASDANAAVAAVTDRYLPAESEYLQDGRSMILTLREDLSYSTGRAMSELRFVSVTRLLVRPGHAAEFVEARAAVKAAAGRKSLTELDDAAKVHADPTYLAALGADWTKRNAALVQAYEASADTDLFSVSPGMSVVPKEWIAADPFWKPKAPPKKSP